MHRLIDHCEPCLTPDVERSWWRRPCGGRDVLQLALPLVLSSLSWTLLTFVDRMFLMWWSRDSLAASFPAALLWWALLCCPLGVCLYAGTFVSQYFGNGQVHRIGAVVWQGVWIGLLASPFAMLPMLFADSIFALAGHVEQVRVEEVTYFWIVSLSTPAMLVSNAFSCFYSGQGKTRIVMLVDMGSVLLNIILDYAVDLRARRIPGCGDCRCRLGHVCRHRGQGGRLCGAAHQNQKSPYVRFARLGIRRAVVSPVAQVWRTGRPANAAGGRRLYGVRVPGR